jgi:hypothetical protein
LKRAKKYYGTKTIKSAYKDPVIVGNNSKTHSSSLEKFKNQNKNLSRALIAILRNMEKLPKCRNHWLRIIGLFCNITKKIEAAALLV